MLEPTVINRWLYTRLTSDGVLSGLIGTRVYADLAPQNSNFPYIVFQQQAASDVRGVGAYRIMTNAQYLVRGIAESAAYSGDLATIANRIDALLHDIRQTTPDGEIVGSWRIQPFMLTELNNGVQYRHYGGLYTILVQASA